MFASAAAVLLPVGCSGSSEGSDGPGSGDRPSDTERARASAARDSRRLAEHYDAVIAAHPALGERLRALRAEVVRHAEAFGDAATPTGGRGSSAPSGTPSPSRSGAPAVVVPGNEKGALAGLAAAERVLAERRTGALLDAPGELARLLASVAAAGAAHVYLLTRADGG